jgi:hypothetical protein
MIVPSYPSGVALTIPGDLALSFPETMAIAAMGALGKIRRAAVAGAASLLAALACGGKADSTEGGTAATAGSGAGGPGGTAGSGGSTAGSGGSTAGAGGSSGSGTAGTGAGGTGTCGSPPFCNWCNGETLHDDLGCPIGFRCANGVDPCVTEPCTNVGAQCPQGQRCHEDGLCWSEDEPPPPCKPAGCGGNSTSCSCSWQCSDGTLYTVKCDYVNGGSHCTCEGGGGPTGVGCGASGIIGCEEGGCCGLPPF